MESPKTPEQKLQLLEQLVKQAKESQKLSQEKLDALLEYGRLDYLANLARKEYHRAERDWIRGPEPVIIAHTSLI